MNVVLELVAIDQLSIAEAAIALGIRQGSGPDPVLPRPPLS